LVGAAAWAFLVFAGVLLPLAALLFAASERRRLAKTSESVVSAAPTRLALYAQTVLTHAVLLAAAVVAARASGVDLFVLREIDASDVAAAAITLAAAVGVAEAYWRSRSAAEREQLWVRQIVPRTGAERRAWVVVSAGAAIAEEVAYRGAFVAFAAAATGSAAVAILMSAVAFAAVHAPQGATGVVYVFVIALLHHALVLFTGTLILAIAVHFAYDVIAGLWMATKHGLTSSGREAGGSTA
jgi:membrane protease YdiL (CAAX protease family)